MTKTSKAKCKIDVELYTGSTEEMIENRVEYQLERAEFYNQTIEFHYGHASYIYDNGRGISSRDNFSLLSIRKGKK